MTARVHPQRHHHHHHHHNNNHPNHHHHQEDSSSSNSSSGSGVASNSSKIQLIGDGASSAAAVVAAVARLHQQQLQLQQQHHLFLEDSSVGSPVLSPCTTPSPGPKLADGRRANKPLMEKRRRARINQSLAALKALILDSARLENTKHSKLEKADILELTVRHLQRQRSLAQPGLSRYKAGYQDCSREVSRYLDAPDIITGNTSPIDPAFKQRLLRHLDSCVSELDLDLGSRPDSGLGSSPGSVTDRVLGPGSPVPLDHPHHAVAAAAAAAAAAHCSAALGAALIKQEIPELETARPDSSTAPGDENNNSSRPTSAFGQVHPSAVAGMPGMEQPGGSQANPNMLSVVQVIPSRLPDGQVVFLLPSHYVQLAAAAAANGISIGPNPPTAIWAATNMSLLKATDKLIKRPLCDDSVSIPADWPVDPTSVGLKPPKSPRIEPQIVEQPLDFTTSSAKKLKAAAARYVAQQQAAAAAANHDPAAAVVGITYTNGNINEDRPPSGDNANGCNSSSSSSSSSSSNGSVVSVGGIVKEEKTAKLEVVVTAPVVPAEVEPSGRITEERHDSPNAMMMQPVKDEEGMWRPW